MPTHLQENNVEAKELLRILTTYGPLQYDQLLALYPGREESISNLLSRFLKQKRLFNTPVTNIISPTSDTAPEPKALKAFWVLLSLWERVAYHTIGAQPAIISLFTEDGQFFDIVVVSPGEEPLLSQIYWQEKVEEQPSKKILVIEEREQIPKLHIKNVAGYCMVENTGVVSFFKL